MDDNILDGLDDIVFQISEFDKDIWLCSADSIYRLEFDQGELIDVGVYEIDNPYFERTYAVPHDGRIIFVNSSGYAFYDPERDDIIDDPDLLSIYGIPERIFISNGESLWIYNGNTWFILGVQVGTDHMEFLNVFDNIQQLAYSSKRDIYWVVTQDNQIFGILQPGDADLSMRHGIYLKEFRTTDRVLLPTPKLDIEMENNSLSFRFVQPDYSGLMDIEYQYRLVGHSDDWTLWASDNNVFTFSYLPPGNYSLEFNTRNAFGQMSSIEPISFRVIPPYWRRPWFYALEVAFFTALLILSIRLNRGSKRYRHINRLLAFLTLILIVEFIQTIAEYKLDTEATPVIDFFIQVSIALFVLPLESLLRKVMFKPNLEMIQNAEKKGRLEKIEKVAAPAEK